MTEEKEVHQMGRKQIQSRQNADWSDRLELLRPMFSSLLAAASLVRHTHTHNADTMPAVVFWAGGCLPVTPQGPPGHTCEQSYSNMISFRTDQLGSGDLEIGRSDQ